MAYGYFQHDYFAGAYFPAVWFAPADETHVPEEELNQYYGSGSRKKAVQRQPAADDLTVEHVQKQWELLDLRTNTEVADVVAAVQAPHIETSPADQIPVKNETCTNTRVSLAAPIASQTKALAPAIGSPIDAAFLPLLPDKAEAAIGAKRKANNDALLAILMEL